MELAVSGRVSSLPLCIDCTWYMGTQASVGQTRTPHSDAHGGQARSIDERKGQV